MNLTLEVSESALDSVVISCSKLYDPMKKPDERSFLESIAVNLEDKLWKARHNRWRGAKIELEYHESILFVHLLSRSLRIEEPWSNKIL